MTDTEVLEKTLPIIHKMQRASADFERAARKFSRGGFQKQRKTRPALDAAAKRYLELSGLYQSLIRELVPS